MPFKSDKQRKWMFANHPEMAKRWAAEGGAKKKKSKARTRGKQRK